jgi:hypothetical protein
LRSDTGFGAGVDAPASEGDDAIGAAVAPFDEQAAVRRAAATTAAPRTVSFPLIMLHTLLMLERPMGERVAPRERAAPYSTMQRGGLGMLSPKKEPRYSVRASQAGEVS